MVQARPGEFLCAASHVVLDGVRLPVRTALEGNIDRLRRALMCAMADTALPYFDTCCHEFANAPNSFAILRRFVHCACSGLCIAFPAAAPHDMRVSWLLREASRGSEFMVPGCSLSTQVPCRCRAFTKTPLCASTNATPRSPSLWPLPGRVVWTYLWRAWACDRGLGA